MKTREECKKNLKNNMTEALEMAQVILQRYIKMEFDLNYPDNTWKKVFFEEVVKKEHKRNLNGLYKNSWRKIETQGLDSYTVEDMDITLIADVLGKKAFSEHCPNYVKKQINNIRDERNKIAHLDYKDELDILVIANNTIQYTLELMLEVKNSLSLSERPKSKEENIIQAKEKWDGYYEQHRDILNSLKEKAIESYKQCLFIGESRSAVETIKYEETVNVSHVENDVSSLENDEQETQPINTLDQEHFQINPVHDTDILSGADKKRHSPYTSLGNLIILAVFIILFIWFLFSYLVGISDILNIVFSILLISGVAGLVFSYIKLKNKWCSKKVEASLCGTKLEKGHNRIIDRNRCLTEIHNWISEKHNIYLLTGESGSGKTHLINTYFRTFTKEPWLIYSDNYYKTIDTEELNKYSYIVFDQFEQALTVKTSVDAKRYIDIISKFAKLNGNKKIIIILRKEYLGDLYNYIEDSSLSIYYLKNRPEEVESSHGYTLNTFLSELSGKSTEALESSKLANHIKQDFKNNYLSFIQLNILAPAIQNNWYDYEKELPEDDTEMAFWYRDKILDFLKSILKSYAYKDIAEMILYLLSSNKGNRIQYSFADIQNITYEDKRILIPIMESLIAAGWVRKIDSSIFSDKFIHYELTHDYYLSLFQEICIEDLTTHICKNIDHYSLDCIKSESQERRDESANDKNKAVIAYLNKENKNKKLTNILLYILLAIVVGFNGWYLFSAAQVVQDRIEFIELASLQVMLCFSVLYIYNYFYSFFSFFQKKRYYLWIIVGLICCALCLPFRSLWGLWIGIEVFLFGILLIMLNSWNIVRDVRYFKTQSKNTLFSGIIIMIIGAFYPFFTNSNRWYMIPFFLLYAVFIVLALTSHLNKKSILGQLGEIVCEKQ